MHIILQIAVVIILAGEEAQHVLRELPHDKLAS